MATIQQILEPKQGGDITYMDMIDEKSSLGDSQIQQLFDGATVFVTGSTGFLGKLLIEKLLRSCPGLQRIYVLARPKKNIKPAHRLVEQFKDQLYDKLRKEQPNFRSKVIIVDGDISQPNLGISEEDRKRLTDEVQIIFHSAATVNMNQKLKPVVLTNVRSTKEMVLLARACTNLKAMVHVSTAFCNCANKEIEEKFYDVSLSGDKLIDLVESLDEKIIEKITPDLIGDTPNTYVYSKWASEDIIRKYSAGLPIVVCRPSMVTSTAKEPIAGWIDNYYGPIGVVVGAGLGILHTLKCNSNFVADMIPGDLVVNSFIAAAWKVSKDHEVTKRAESPSVDELPLIYNNVSSVQNPITWKRFMFDIETFGAEAPLNNAIWYCFLVLTPSNLINSLLWILTHWIPAYVLDAVAVSLGKKPKLKDIYRKINKFSGVIEHFASNEWKFYDDNVTRLFNEMCETDKQIFDFNIGSLNWTDYLYTLVHGLRLYILKEQNDTVPQSRRKAIIFKILHYVIITILVLSILSMMWLIL